MQKFHSWTSDKYPSARYNRLSEPEVLGYYIDYLLAKNISFNVSNYEGSSPGCIHGIKMYLESKIREAVDV